MKSCCIQTGERFFASQYPFEGPMEQDELATHVLNLCKKWGPITRLVKDQFYIRSTSSPRLGVDAKTGTFRCSAKCNGGLTPYIVIGSRLFYFIWRINMTSATAWSGTTASGSDRVELILDSNWPRPEHVAQVRTAFEMYFGADALLDTKGLAELNRQIQTLIFEPALISEYVVDLAELFVLHHEIQHQAPIAQFAGEPAGVTVHLPATLSLSSRRADWWRAEMMHDANSLWALLLSTTALFHDTFRMPTEEARAQAASIVCTGADAALDSLQRLEELRYGIVDVTRAATMREFTHHPPARFRRDALSLTSYFLVTGKSVESLWRKDFPDSWLFVANNVAGHMKVRDELIGAYLTSAEQ
jgi:hypothetical protein